MVGTVGMVLRAVTLTVATRTYPNTAWTLQSILTYSSTSPSVPLRLSNI